MNQIIGQEHVAKEVSRIIDNFKASDAAIRPHFILTGSSGSGKSYTIRHLAGQAGVGYFEINAAQLTKEGTSGNSLSKALSPLLQLSGKLTIVFVDEFDKLFISGNSNDSFAHESSNGVQNEFLKVLESETTAVFGDYGKYINASAENVLFIFAGAFNGEENLTLDRLRELGIKTEFLGRVGLVYNTKPYTLEELYLMLDNSELLTNYCDLFENIDRKQAVATIREFLARNHEMNTLGARLINTLVNQYFISGGKLEEKTVKKAAFQRKLEFA
jgi:ATP-dependent protease Clp ATPase subunit